jgi:hypothetical protein
LKRNRSHAHLQLFNVANHACLSYKLHLFVSGETGQTHQPNNRFSSGGKPDLPYISVCVSMYSHQLREKTSLVYYNVAVCIHVLYLPDQGSKPDLPQCCLRKCVIFTTAIVSEPDLP